MRDFRPDIVVNYCSLLGATALDPSPTMANRFNTGSIVFMLSMPYLRYRRVRAFIRRAQTPLASIATAFRFSTRNRC
jgi:hypothetical protein